MQVQAINNRGKYNYQQNKALYNTLTTGEPLDEMYIKAMNEYKG